MSILTYDNVDFKKLTFNSPEKVGMIYYSGISYKDKPLYIQTPKLKCLHDSNECIDRKAPSMDLENINNNFKFYDFLIQLDEANINNTFNNSQQWFDKEIPRDTIDDMYKRILKPVKKGCRPNYTFKIPTIKNNVQCPIYDQNKICQSFDKCNKDVDVELILHIRGLKFLKQNYYCDMYISQIKVYLSNDEKYSVLETYSFNDTSENENIDSSNKTEIVEKECDNVDEQNIDIDTENVKNENEEKKENGENKKDEEIIKREKIEVNQEDKIEDEVDIEKEEMRKKLLLLEEQLKTIKDKF